MARSWNRFRPGDVYRPESGRAGYKPWEDKLSERQRETSGRGFGQFGDAIYKGNFRHRSTYVKGQVESRGGEGVHGYVVSGDINLLRGVFEGTSDMDAAFRVVGGSTFRDTYRGADASGYHHAQTYWGDRGRDPDLFARAAKAELTHRSAFMNSFFD